MSGKIAIIAGGGELPNRLVRSLEEKGQNYLIVALDGQTDTHLYEGRPVYHSRIGKVGTIVKYLKGETIQDLILCGKIRRPTLSEMRPDWKTTKFFARVGLQSLGDDGLLKAVRDELEGDGFTIHPVQDFIDDLMAEEGPLGKHKPSKEHMADIARGIEVTQILGKLDVGQSAVIQEGLVLGVEGIEGTDELIKRCGPLARKGRSGVLVKTCKPQQDKALDMPTIGIDTLRHIHEAGFTGAAIHAGQTILMNREECIAYADKNKLFIVGINVES